MSFIEEKEYIIKKISTLESKDVLAKIKEILDIEQSALSENQIQEVRNRRIAYSENPELLISEKDFLNSIQLKYGF